MRTSVLGSREGKRWIVGTRIRLALVIEREWILFACLADKVVEPSFRNSFLYGNCMEHSGFSKR